MAGKWIKISVLAPLLIGVSISSSAGRTASEPNTCATLAGSTLDGAKVVEARSAPAGSATSMGFPGLDLPVSCRVSLDITPTSDSSIKTEVWLPATGWNGRFWGVGNGGMAGSIEVLQMTVALSRGYAVASTDTGHKGSAGDASWAFGHPEKIIDFEYRAIHQTAVLAKMLIRSFYGRAPEYSYFVSGSNGGRAALMEAQRYPEDYDGIVAGAPANNGTSGIASMAWVQQQLLDKPGAWIPPEKLPAIAAATMRECDGKDGLADGLIDDPRQCRPHLGLLKCKGAETNSCLTAPQISALTAIYRGPGKSPDGRPHYGFPAGSEFDWMGWITGSAPRQAFANVFATQAYRYLVFRDADWTLEKFDFARDAEFGDRILGPGYNAVDPDLSRFAARGGKLILYHGWADAALPPEHTIDYYERTRRTMGTSAAARFLRLYMVPGLGHVYGGPGLNSFGQAYAPKPGADPRSNMSAALQQWVERGIAPMAIEASHYEGGIKPLIETDGMTRTRTRPLCPYPQVARWIGKGSIDVAENFHCVGKSYLPLKPD